MNITSVILLSLASMLFLIQPIDVIIKKQQKLTATLDILVFSFRFNEKNKKKKASISKRTKNAKLLLYMIKYVDIRIDKFTKSQNQDDIAQTYIKSAYQGAALYPLISALQIYARSLYVADDAFVPNDNENADVIDITLSSRPYLILLSIIIFTIDKIKRRFGVGKGYERADIGKH